MSDLRCQVSSDESTADDEIMTRYWLTPPELEPLKDGRFDPYPYPHGFGDRNALLVPWDKPWYANPPFHDLMKHVRRAIEQGGPGILVMPIGPANALILKAGLTMEYLGRVSWIDPDTGRRGGSCHCVKVVFP